MNIWKRYVNEIDSEAKLVIIGQGIDKEALEMKISEYNLEKNIKLVGFLANQFGPLEYVAKSKYFIFPSYEEAWAIVIGEAMACKTPVYCYGLDELKQVWSDNLFFSPIGDYNNIFENIKKYHFRDPSYKDKKISSYKYVAKYDWNKIFLKDLKIIENLF